MDFGQIKKHVSEIISMLDHKFLNDLDWFHDDYPPSSENIARYISKALQKRIGDSKMKVSRVAAWESEDACATYITN
jgi:6-pyruvoyltetrahydropterin/6-carboxytetrahydropterin synthase